MSHGGSPPNYIIAKGLNMPIKKLTHTPIPLKSKVLPQKKGAELLEMSLPDGPKTPDTNLSHYLILIYGREKIGKTTIFSTFPDALFLCTEPGAKGLRIAEFNAENGGIKNWKIFRRAVDLLEEDKAHKYKTIIIDTVDRAYDMCLDYVCEEQHIEYPGADSSGEADYGRSWRAVKQEFITQLHRLSQAGYGVAFTSHAREETFKNKQTGEQYTRIFPSMSSQARKVVEAIVDLFFYAEYVRNPDGSVRRILICQGDETIWAGARSGMVQDFPQFLPMDRDNGYEIIKQAFGGEFTGIDPKEVVPSRITTKTGRDFLQKAKIKAVRPT